MEIYQVHMRRTAPSVFSTILPGSHQARFVIDGHCYIARILLRHLADSGHPPREATPLDQRPAPPRAKKTRGAEKHRRVQILILVRTRFFD